MLEKLSVPVFWGTVTYREYQNMEYKYTEEEARAHLNQKLMDFLAELEEKGVQIIEKNRRVLQHDVRVRVHVAVLPHGGVLIVDGDLSLHQHRILIKN